MPIAIISIVSLLSLPDNASAYSYLEDWAGRPYKIDNKLTFKLSREMLYSGENLGGQSLIAESACDVCGVVEAWNDVRGMNNKVACDMNPGSYVEGKSKRNGISTIYFANGPFTQDAYAVIFVKGKYAGLSAEIKEADIGIRNDFNWNYGEDFGAQRELVFQNGRHTPLQDNGSPKTNHMSPFREILLHEIGHAHGLDHELHTPSVMHPSSLGLLYGYYRGEQEAINSCSGLRYRPLGDEANGGRSIYPNNYEAHNLMASFFQPFIPTNGWEPGQYKAGLPSHESNYGDSVVTDVCPGNSTLVSWTIINNGTSAMLNDVGYFASQNDYISNGDILFDVDNRIEFSGEANPIIKRVTVPEGLERGEYYYLGAYANYHGNYLTEQFESDNRTTNMRRYRFRQNCP